MTTVKRRWFLPLLGVGCIVVFAAGVLLHSHGVVISGYYGLLIVGIVGGLLLLARSFSSRSATVLHGLDLLGCTASLFAVMMVAIGRYFELYTLCALMLVLLWLAAGIRFVVLLARGAVRR